MRPLPLRRSQLSGSNGPGSLIVSPEGETAIIGALDYWFLDEHGQPLESLSEFEIFEPRLKGFLGIDKLYMAPDYRKPTAEVPNTNITIPLLRFPKMHYCSFCSSLKEFNYTIKTAKQYCEECDKERYFKQVPFIMICSKGHISDFPWRKWAHGSESITCNGKMKLVTIGGATLDSWTVKCSCGASKSLKGITSTNSEKENSSVLAEKLNSAGKDYKCPGHKAWCGEVYEPCDQSPVAILRNSINVYMAQKISVISLPGENNLNVDAILEALNRNAAIKGAIDAIPDISTKVAVLQGALGSQIKATLDDYEKAVLYIDGKTQDNEQTIETSSPNLLRIKEFEKLCIASDEPYLKVVPEWDSQDSDAKDYAGAYLPFIGRVNRVTKLRETTVLAGFKRLSRTDENGHYSYSSSFDSLYHKRISNDKKWLPANTVYGEGIFIQFNLDKIRTWEETSEVIEYFYDYKERISQMPHIMPEIIEYPRNLMMHTLAHLMIEEISNISGYNMASIRERMYLNENQAAILIYTSAGDIEGTFGGLVRLARKDKFFTLLDKSIASARWCSSDPVCSELGVKEGQGFNNVNGAACYNCSHLPETSCETGNMYLDRTLLTGSTLGFFKDL